MSKIIKIHNTNVELEITINSPKEITIFVESKVPYPLFHSFKNPLESYDVFLRVSNEFAEEYAKTSKMRLMSSIRLPNGALSESELYQYFEHTFV